MKRLFPLLLASVALLASACGEVTPYAAKVNSASISRKDVDTELTVILKNKKYLEGIEASLAQEGVAVKGPGDGTVSSAFAARLLSRRILLTLIHQEVERRKINISKASLDQSREEVKSSFGPDASVFNKFPRDYQNYLVQNNADVTALQNHLATDKVDPASLRKYFDEHADEFQVTCVSHILVDAKETAEQLRSRIQGGTDFAQIAKTESKDNQGPSGGSAGQGGALGCLSAQETASFTPPFKEAMEKLPVNELSQPVQTEFGYHLIKVTEKKAQSFEESQQDIAQKLQSNAQDEFQSLLQRLVRRARIKVNPKYGTFSKANGQFGVVPPEAPLPTTTGVPDPNQQQLPPGPGGP